MTKVHFVESFSDFHDAVFFLESLIRGYEPEDILEAKVTFVNRRWQVGLILNEEGEEN